MSNEPFTPEAALLWAGISKEAQARILANVFCVKCRGSVQIKNYSAVEEHGDVVLTGVCAKCGGKVVRVVETSESNHSRN